MLYKWCSIENILFEINDLLVVNLWTKDARMHCPIF